MARYDANKRQLFVTREQAKELQKISVEYGDYFAVPGSKDRYGQKTTMYLMSIGLTVYDIEHMKHKEVEVFITKKIPKLLTPPGQA